MVQPPEDPLAPARGCLFGLLFGLFLWLSLALMICVLVVTGLL